MDSQNGTKIVFKPFLRFIIDFHNRVDLYGRILKQEIDANPVLQIGEVGLIYEAFIIKISAEWELFQLNILAYCVAMDTSRISKHLELSLPKKISFDNAFAVLNGLDFISITSVADLKNISKKILEEDSNPFKQFENGFLNRIDEVYALRNYISHKSKRSKIRLEKMYRDKHQINEFIFPGNFLVATKTNENMKTSNFGEYVGTFLCIAVEAWKFLDIGSYEFVYKDDKSKEGMFLGMAKMREVFKQLTIENGLS